MTVGNKISTLRRQKGLSQKQLAEILMISPQAVSRWEQDENMPDLDNIVQLSKIFDVSTDYLLKDPEIVDADDIPRTDENSEQGTFDTGQEKVLFHFIGRSNIRSGKRWRQNFIVRNLQSIALVAFLVMGFGWGYWHPGWMVFLVASAIRSFSIYTIAIVVFLAAGFYFDMWRVIWIALPVAWLVNTLFKDFRRGKADDYEDEDW